MIYCGDLFDVLPTLPENFFRCAVTSPPYWALRDYGHNEQIGREATPEAYVARMVDVFALVHRVLCDDGTLWLNIGDKFDDSDGQLLLPHRVALALRSAGWFVRCDAVWNKTRWMPNGGFSRPILVHEYVFMLTKRVRGYYYNADAIREPHSPVSLKRWASSGVAKLGAKNAMGHKVAEGAFKTKTVIPNPLGKLKTSVWDICPSDYKGAHFATMPEDLARTCILASSEVGDAVLDPFNGSGTTGAVAVGLHRRYVGIELNADYVEIAKRRIGAVAPLFGEHTA